MPKPMNWTPEITARFWANEARHPENYFTNHSGHKVARKLKPFLKRHNRVLDYGCGLGFLVPHLAALGLEVTAADVSPEAIEATNQRNADTRGFQGAHLASSLQMPFDAIVSVEVVEHLTDAQLDEYFSTMWRLLEPGGTAIITTPNNESLQAAEVYCPCCDNTFHRWQHMRSWNAQTLGGALVRHGFKPWIAMETNFGRNPFKKPNLIHVVTR